MGGSDELFVVAAERGGAIAAEGPAAAADVGVDGCCSASAARARSSMRLGGAVMPHSSAMISSASSRHALARTGEEGCDKKAFFKSRGINVANTCRTLPSTGASTAKRLLAAGHAAAEKTEHDGDPPPTAGAEGGEEEAAAAAAAPDDAAEEEAPPPSFWRAQLSERVKCPHNAVLFSVIVFAKRPIATLRYA